jgi:hypothetical protein
MSAPESAGPAPVTLSCLGATRAEIDDLVTAFLIPLGYREQDRLGAATTFVQRRRPNWAMFLAVVLAVPTAGLALLLLRIRRERIGSVVIEDALLGARVQLSGDLPEGLLARLDRPVPVGTPAPTVTLLIHPGRTVPLAACMVLGRDPDPQTAGHRLPTLAIDDPWSTLSRNHALLGADADGVWVADLRSRNGTVIVGPDGDRYTCPPGGRYRVPAGSSILLATVPVGIRFGRPGFDGGRSRASGAECTDRLRIGPRHRTATRPIG